MQAVNKIWMSSALLVALVGCGGSSSSPALLNGSGTYTGFVEGKSCLTGQAVRIDFVHKVRITQTADGGKAVDLTDQQNVAYKGFIGTVFNRIPPYNGEEFLNASATTDVKAGQAQDIYYSNTTLDQNFKTASMVLKACPSNTLLGQITQFSPS